MAFADHQDMLSRYPERDLAQLTDPAGLQINWAVVEAALEDASELAWSYVPGRYVRPATPAATPRVLKRIVCDLAVYSMMTLRPQATVEDTRERQKDTIRFLEGVAAGRISLGLTEAGSAAQATDYPQGARDNEDRIFNDRTLGGF